MIRYPIQCPNCSQQRIHPANIAFHDTHTHDGVEYVLDIANLPVLKCQNCDWVLYTDTTDTLIGEAIRQAADFLSSADIRRIREQLGWTMDKLAEVMGVDPEKIEFWETDIMFPTRAENDELRRLSVFGGVAETNG